MILDLYEYQTFKLVTGQFYTITETKAYGADLNNKHKLGSLS